MLIVVDDALAWGGLGFGGVSYRGDGKYADNYLNASNEYFLVGAASTAMTTNPYRAPLVQTPPVRGRRARSLRVASPRSVAWAVVLTLSAIATDVALCGSFVGTSSRTVLGSSMRGRCG